MAIAYSPNITTLGLVNFYDFKNIRSYPGTGTAVNDLISNVGLTIAGSPTYNSQGFLTFDNDQITQYVFNPAFPMPTDDFTLSVWFISNFNNATPQTPFTYIITGNDNHLLLYLPTSTSIQPHTLFDTTFLITVPDMTNRWCNITWTRQRTTGIENLYLNGKFIGTVTRLIGTQLTANGYLMLGQEQDSPGGTLDPAQNLDGSISSFAVYNRVLTDSEVEINFNAQRGRFGI